MFTENFSDYHQNIPSSRYSVARQHANLNDVNSGFNQAQNYGDENFSFGTNKSFQKPQVTNRCSDWSSTRPRVLQDITSQLNECGAPFGATFNNVQTSYTENFNECSGFEPWPKQVHQHQIFPEQNLQQIEPQWKQQSSWAPSREQSTMYQSHRMRTNRRKRERNMNINHAFESLRCRIPNLPTDTKVSKIRILQLACEYIRHLDNTLKSDDEANDLNKHETTSEKSPEFVINPLSISAKRRRTDWGRIQSEIERHAMKQNEMECYATKQSSAEMRNNCRTSM